MFSSNVRLVLSVGLLQVCRNTFRTVCRNLTQLELRYWTCVWEEDATMSRVLIMIWVIWQNRN